MLGDISLAEPGAVIGFAGQRVIEETIRETLPEGFQRAEYLLEHGMVDMVVRRAELRPTLVRIFALLRDKTPTAEVVPIKGDERKRAARKPAAAEALAIPPAPKAGPKQGPATKSSEHDTPELHSL